MIGSGIGSRIDWLHYFIFTSPFFSYWLKGSVAMVANVDVPVSSRS
jgi:hypothetical protein